MGSSKKNGAAKKKNAAGRGRPPLDLHNLLTMLGRASRIGHATDEQAEKPFSIAQYREWLSRDRYVYTQELNAGGMARIFRAEDLHLCRQVAMKILPEGHTPAELCRFIHEAQMTAQLQHPNIIPIYDSGIDPFTNQPFFTMRLVDGGRNLLDVIIGLRKGKRECRRLFGTLAERLPIVLKAGDALAYAHARGVVHQDVKPANILVGDHGEVYLIDWGIAKLDPRAGTAATAGRDTRRFASIQDAYRNARRPDDANFLGSPVHMAPEQFIANELVDARSDIYGYGCTLYEAVTLHPPFDPNLPLDQLLTLKRRGEFTPMETYVRGHYELAAIVRKCLEPARSKRYANVRQVQGAVRAILQNMHEFRTHLLALRERIEHELEPCTLRNQGGCRFYKGVVAMLTPPAET